MINIVSRITCDRVCLPFTAHRTRIYLLYNILYYIIILCFSFYSVRACTAKRWISANDVGTRINSPGRRPGWPKTAFPRHGVQYSRSIRPVVHRPGRRRLSSSHGPENHLGKCHPPSIICTPNLSMCDHFVVTVKYVLFEMSAFRFILK